MAATAARELVLPARGVCESEMLVDQLTRLFEILGDMGGFRMGAGADSIGREGGGTGGCCGGARLVAAAAAALFLGLVPVWN